jgi:hypothetical protein
LVAPASLNIAQVIFFWFLVAGMPGSNGCSQHCEIDSDS